MGRPWAAYIAGPAPVAILAFGVYWRTLARHGDLGNGPELAVAASQFGVPHPTGFPLYTLAAGIFVRMAPLGTVIFKTALFSALLTALAAALVYVAAFALLRRRWAAMLTSLLFAYSATVWSAATVTEVHGLHLALSAGMLAALMHGLRSHDQRIRDRCLKWAAIGFGLSLANHLMALTWLPLMALGVDRLRDRNRGWKGVGIPVLLAVAPLTLYAYLPIAAFRDPPLNWGDARSMANFVHHVTDGTDVTNATWRDRLVGLVNYGGWPEEHVREGYLLSQFGAAIIWLAPIGLWFLARRRRAAHGMLVVAYAVPVAWTIGAGIVEPASHFATSHMIVALWIGAGARHLGHLAALAARRAIGERKGRRRIRALVEIGALALPAMVLAGNFRVNDLSANNVMEPLGRALIEKPARNAILIATGRTWAFPALYAQQVERRRPDVVLLLEPFFREPNFRLIRRESRRGIVVSEPECHHMPGKVADEAHGWCRIHQLIWQNYARRPVYVAGPSAEMLVSEEAIRSRLPAFRRLAASLPVVEFVPARQEPLPPIPTPPVLVVVPRAHTEAGEHQPAHGHTHDHHHEH